jgi:hypothetical protein
MIHVVKATWVAASLKMGKMKNPRTYSPDPALFMNDVVICCGDIPTGDKEAIEGGVLAMGGQIAPALSKMVTHLIALDLSEERCQLAISKRLNLLIVLPHWFDDCLKVGRRISERPYTLPDPEILNQVDAAPIPAARTSQQIRDATSPDPTNEPIPPIHTAHLEPPRAIKAFAGKNVKLGDDLSIGTKLRGIITEMIKAGGGDVVTKVEEADIFICTFRSGPDYIKASQNGKDVGNLSWLYYLITQRKAFPASRSTRSVYQAIQAKRECTLRISSERPERNSQRHSSRTTHTSSLPTRTARSVKQRRSGASWSLTISG